MPHNALNRPIFHFSFCNTSSSSAVRTMGGVRMTMGLRVSLVKALSEERLVNRYQALGNGTCATPAPRCPRVGPHSCP